ncbi:MAG TPA: hypothetical protein VEC35_08370 [Noviherbaspirillum sp.]|nr:hypothetical protein [Noviherbaspirillum sp.]
MHRAKSPMTAAAMQRPAKLYRYSQRQSLERSLRFGEFLLQPPAAQAAAGDSILPFGPRATTGGFLTLSLASTWDAGLFDAFSGADCCLIVHDAEQFGERIHRAAQRLLPSWAGIDAAISYGVPSPLGDVFSKNRLQAAEKEWLFAWRPTQPALLNKPVTISIGSIEGIAELRDRGA